MNFVDSGSGVRMLKRCSQLKEQVMRIKGMQIKHKIVVIVFLFTKIFIVFSV